MYAGAKNFRRGGFSTLGRRIIARIDHRDLPRLFVGPRYPHWLIFHVAVPVYQPERPKLALREYIRSAPSDLLGRHDAQTYRFTRMDAREYPLRQ